MALAIIGTSPRTSAPVAPETMGADSTLYVQAFWSVVPDQPPQVLDFHVAGNSKDNRWAIRPEKD